MASPSSTVKNPIQPSRDRGPGRQDASRRGWLSYPGRRDSTRGNISPVAVGETPPPIDFRNLGIQEIPPPIGPPPLARVPRRDHREGPTHRSRNPERAARQPSRHGDASVWCPSCPRVPGRTFARPGPHVKTVLHSCIRSPRVLKISWITIPGLELSGPPGPRSARLFPWEDRSDVRHAGQGCAVTGGTSGIGREAALVFARRVREGRRHRASARSRGTRPSSS